MPFLNRQNSITTQTAPYWITVSILLLWGIFPLLNYILFLTFAVPTVGAYKRGTARWKIFSISTVTAALAFLALQYVRCGSRGMILFSEMSSLGPYVKINFMSLLVTSLIFLPLSLSCAIDRINKRACLHENPLISDKRSNS